MVRTYDSNGLIAAEIVKLSRKTKPLHGVGTLFAFSWSRRNEVLSIAFSRLIPLRRGEAITRNNVLSGGFTMRAFVMSMIVGLVVFAWSGMARAQAVDAAVGTAVNAAANVDANMRFHNGRWWYWQPNNNHWMVYHNNSWIAPNASGAYLYNGASIWGSPYTTGYRGSYYGNGYYGNNYYGNGYYGNGYYGNRYYGNGYGYGNMYGRGYGYGNRGANVGANIGGAIGGNAGAGIGAAIGGAIGNR
jgi:hypothetical protein